MPESRRLPANRGVPIHVTFDGAPISCFEGETLATALLANGINAFGTTRDNDPRQPLCNMGTCFDCAVTVDGVPLVRSCLIAAVDGMDVHPSKGV